MGKHRATVPQRKKWTATATRKGTTRTKPVRAGDIMQTMHGGYGGRISLAAAMNQTYGQRRGGGRTTLTQYSRGAATVGGKVVNARVRSVYGAGGRFQPVAYQVMPPGWRMGR